MRRRILFGTLGVLLLGWLIHVTAGAMLSQMLAARVGAALLRFGQGKFNDPALFIHRRTGELLWLITLAFLCAAGHPLLERLIRRRAGVIRWGWAAHAALGFTLLNIWMGAAGNTALFWGAVGAGAGFQNLMQFHFKRIVFEENPASRGAVLVGNSQTRAQIDEGLLNERFGTNLWTAELHFPGSHAYDLLLIERQLRRANPQLVICYLNENYFYNGSAGESVPSFFGLRELPDAWRRGAVRHLEGKGVFYGLLGDMLPLFRYREALAQRLFSASAVQLKQSQYNTSLAVDLETRAREAASRSQLDAESEFQKRAFEEFVARCQQANRRVIALDGQSNPILTRQLDPSVRTDLTSFLDQLQHGYSNLVVVRGNALPQQSSADYEDLTHVNPEAQRRFTLWLAEFIEKQVSRPQVPLNVRDK